MKRGGWALALALLAALVGCGPRPSATPAGPRGALSPTPNPTATPSPTATDTPTPTFTPSPTATPRPLPTVPQGVQVTPFTVPWPTPTATPNPAPEMDALPYAPVHILTPGPGSKITTPIDLRFRVRVNGVRVMHIELLGEDGRLLFRQVERFRAGAKGWRAYHLDVPFEIRAESEWGRLQIFLRDRLNRPLFQQAVPLVLLRQGQQDFITQETWTAAITIDQPRSGTLVEGGELVISGLAVAPTGVVEILVLGDDGRVWYTATAPVSDPNPQGYGAYEARISYDLDRTHQVFIVVQAYGKHVPGVMYLNHAWVYLSP